ncbi:MAG TPA: phage protein Gp27 family protein [Candidatus Binataceae bacterium]|nr:phage protein Gp27 family protein [Candidatus Binataceae bacterium]
MGTTDLSGGTPAAAAGESQTDRAAVRRPSHGPLPNTLTPGRIGKLPQKLKDELDRRLTQSDFGSYRGLSKWLRDNGYKISHAALHKYAKKFERRLEAVRLAVAEAKVIVEETAGDDHAMRQGLMRLVQTHLFLVLSKVLDAQPDRLAPNFHAISRSVEGLTRADVMLEQWYVEEREHIASQVTAAQKSLDEARDQGLSPEAAERIRAALLEIKS